MGIREDVGGAIERFRSLEPIDLVPRLTLVFVLIYRVDSSTLQFATIVLGLTGLVFPGLHRSRFLWLATTAVFGVRILLAGHNLDNHGYLITWWCLALACAYSLDDPERAFRTQGRLMIGWCFLFATLWKGVLAHDYVSGDFFHLAYLNDHRLIDVTRLIGGGLSDATLAENRALIRQLRDASLGLESVTLTSTPRIHPLSLLSAWWTVIIEAVVTVLFLLPVRRVPAYLRDGSLLLFSVTTYAIVPIMGFGLILMVMGIAQTRPQDGGTRLAYVLASFVIVFYRYVPWLDWVADRVV